jgi:hypothetical protein
MRAGPGVAGDLFGAFGTINERHVPAPAPAGPASCTSSRVRRHGSGMPRSRQILRASCRRLREARDGGGLASRTVHVNRVVATFSEGTHSHVTPGVG